MSNAQVVATEIVKQLGGSRFMAMTGVKVFMSEPKAVGFKFKGSTNSNYCRIELNEMDTYDIQFKKIRGMKIADVAQLSGVYNDDLQGSFTRQTGLYTRL